MPGTESVERVLEKCLWSQKHRRPNSSVDTEYDTVVIGSTSALPGTPWAPHILGLEEERVSETGCLSVHSVPRYSPDTCLHTAQWERIAPENH